MSSSTPFEDLRNRPPVEWLRERDIDLLVCSELHSGESPLHRLLVGGWSDGNARFLGAGVSYPQPDGETDIVVLFESDSGRLVLLIEDKIDAEYQPEQPERYRARAERLQASGGAGLEVETVLLAPEAYFENEGSDVFDRQLSYETVVEALVESPDRRSQFLGDTLRNGIEVHRRGYVAVPDEARTKVWNAFWKSCMEATPLLRMGNPGNKPARAGFIEFRDAEGLAAPAVRRGVRIVYKYKGAHCEVDLQFSGMNDADLGAALRGVLESDMSVEKAGKSASVRVEVPLVDFDRMPEGQEDSIRDGLYAAERLRLFFIDKELRKLVVPT